MRDRLGTLLARAREQLVLQAAVMLGLYALLWQELRKSATLEPEAYTEPILVAAIPSHARLAVVVVAMLLPVAIGYRQLRWSEIDPKRRTRWFVLAIAFVLGWAFATYDYNLFFDQAHTIDRLLLILLTGLIVVHPGFAVAQLVLVLVILGQLMYPLPDAIWHWPDKRLPVDVLVLFASFLYVRLVFRSKARVYLFGVLALVGVTYVHAAIEKMRLGPHPWSWLTGNDLRNIFIAAHNTGGWLRNVSDATILTIADVLGWLRLPMAFGTIAIELAPLLLLAHPRATRWIPAALIALHATIFATTGIFFWKWMVLHGALIWLATMLTRDAEGELDEPPTRSTWCGGIYRPAMVALFVTFVLGSRWFLTNVPFAWADSRVANHFVIRGVGASGRTYPIDPRFFGPYDLTINQSRYYYAFGGPVLVDTYGTTKSWELAQALERASLDDLPAIRQRFAEVHAEGRRANALAMFFHLSLRAAMKRGDREHWLHALAPPYHFQTTVPRDAYALQEPLVAITLTFEEWFYDGERMVKTREEMAGRIPLQPPDGS